MRPLSWCFVFACPLGWAVFFRLGTQAFSTRQPMILPGLKSTRTSGSGCQTRRKALLMANIFDSFSRFLNNGDGENEGNNDESKSTDDDDQEAGVHRIVTIPVESIKPGGLRVFIMLYLMGMQNTPDRGSWRTDSAPSPSSSTSRAVDSAEHRHMVDFLFHDRTAMLSVRLQSDRIDIDRVGSTPSTAYLMQEAVVVQGILDELDKCAFDTAIARENRLLILPEPQDAIEKARDSLSFG